MQKVTVITRSFQPGADANTFDVGRFDTKVASPIESLLAFPIVDKVIVISNGESGNKFAECMVEAGKTPTVLALERRFFKQISDGRIVAHICKSWGPNPGSATALNEGAEVAKQDGAKWILNWSSEIQIDGCRIKAALDFAEEKGLTVVGFLRERWSEKEQWKVVQNTAALWHLESLMDIDGFSRECNGTGQTLHIDSFGQVPVAGMEDFHAMLRLFKENPDFRWGMVGRANPLRWDTNFEPGSQRLKCHTKKVARQYQVMKIYAKRIFPNSTFDTVMDNLFSCCEQA